MSLKPIIHNGQVISISHLAPMQIACPCDEIDRDLAISVDFKNHCYTEAFDTRKHTKPQIILYDAPDKPRCFCPLRHGLSVRLPAIVQALPARKVNQTAEVRNYVYAMPLEVDDKTYEMYFMLQRAESVPGIDLRMTVESAYEVSTPTVLQNRPNSIRFKVLATKVLKREQIRFAAR